MTEVEDFAFHHSSPHSLQSFSSPAAPPLSKHIRVSDVSGYSAANEIIEDAFADDETFTEEEGDVQRRTSGQSVISSFPGSVIQCPPEHTTPTRPSPLQTFRHGSIFRSSSSVRAMQMRDDDTESITPHHRRSGSHTSARSRGSSPQISPSKRHSRSNQTSPLKGSKLKKEFPLVLLHCTLLPPASSTVPVNCDNDLYAALLPEEYQKRWNSLQDRLADPETNARGVLIPHPQDDYELLEERLLESLELENPRVKGSHFFRRDGAAGDSGFESASSADEESSDEATKDARCPDCGKCLHLKSEGERKWEIKVFAANGLMRAGAWSAAWREMEKVDIEISLAMPEDVRREVNARLEALRAAQEASQLHSDDVSPPATGSREEEIYGSRPASSGHEMPQHAFAHGPPIDEAHSAGKTQLPPQGASHVHGILVDVFGDRKNILILLLSIMVLFYAMTGAAKHQTAISKPGSTAPTTSTSTFEVQTSTIRSTSVLTSIMTVQDSTPSGSGTPLPSAEAVEGQDTPETAGNEDSDAPSNAEVFHQGSLVQDDPEEALEILEG